MTDTMREEFEACKREAQQWKQEARTANAIIAEIYQVVTGKTGEPGNWNGAKPVRDRIATLEAENARLREALTELVALRALRVALDAQPHFSHVYWWKQDDARYTARWPTAWTAAAALTSQQGEAG